MYENRSPKSHLSNSNGQAASQPNQGDAGAEVRCQALDWRGTLERLRAERVGERAQDFMARALG
jgi:hypothetical protein